MRSTALSSCQLTCTRPAQPSHRQRACLCHWQGLHACAGVTGHAKSYLPGLDLPCIVLWRQSVCLILCVLRHAVPQEGDPEGWWEETFNGHTDSKPSGPEAISLDLSFPGSQHIYGIPERASNFSLQPTTGGAGEGPLCKLCRTSCQLWGQLRCWLRRQEKHDKS